MKRMLLRFWKEESGMGTIEIVVIIAVLVAVALIFRKGIFEFVGALMAKIFNPDAIPGPTPTGS